MTNRSIISLLWLLGIGVICVGAYYHGLSGPLLFDDAHTIVDNNKIKIERLGFSELRDAASSFVSGRRQLAMLSFALNHYFFGMDVPAYKSVNLALHLVTGFVVFLLARTIVSYLVIKDRSEETFIARWMPEIVTTLWLLSPINLTSVLYVSQRMTIMSALFVFLGAYIYCIARVRMLQTGKLTPFPVLGVILCVAAAFSSKANGILLVPLILLIEFIVFGFRSRDGTRKWSLIGLFIVFLVAGAVVFALVVRIDLASLLNGYSTRPFSVDERLLTQTRALLFYVGLILVPIERNFGLWHDDFPISTSLLTPIDTLLATIVLALLAGIAISVARKHPLCSLGILWFFVGHSIESTIVPLEMLHEHRNYLPSFGVLLTLTALLANLEKASSVLRTTLLAVLALASTFVLYSRALAWSETVPHAIYEFENHPTSGRSNYRLANLTVGLASAGVPGARETAYKLYERAIRYEESSITPEVGMILATSQLEGFYDTRWIDSAVNKLRIYGGSTADVNALKGLRRCSLDGKCKFKGEDFLPLFEAASRTSNHKMLTEAAVFFRDVPRDKQRSLALFRRATLLAPRDTIARLNYIGELIASGEREEASSLLDSLEDGGFRNLERERQWITRLRAQVAELE